VNVEKLSFRYPSSDVDVFTNVNFNVEAGERIAVIGPERHRKDDP